MFNGGWFHKNYWTGSFYAGGYVVGAVVGTAVKYIKMWRRRRRR